jgi:hypothetical protein
MPIRGACFFDFSSFLANVIPFVAGAGCGDRAGRQVKEREVQGNSV